MRKLLVAGLLALVSCSNSPAATPPQSRGVSSSPVAATAPPTVVPTPLPATPPPTPGPGDFRVDGAMEYLRTLASDIGRREAGTEGDSRAAAYVEQVLRELGYVASQQRFPLPQGGTSQNVIGHPPGYRPGIRHLIVGGHIDSLRGPGANDNASGVAVALEIVRAFVAQPAALPVVFVAFGAEEVQPAPNKPHHVGSRFYVESLATEERSALVAFLNIDMVGYGDGLIAGRLPIGPREATERLLKLAPQIGVPLRERVTPDWSDNGPFLKTGLNAGWLWSGEDRCCYHNPRDRFERVQRASVDRTGRLALAFLRSYS